MVNWWKALIIGRDIQIAIKAFFPFWQTKRHRQGSTQLQQSHRQSKKTSSWYWFRWWKMSVDGDVPCSEKSKLHLSACGLVPSTASTTCICPLSYMCSVCFAICLCFVSASVLSLVCSPRVHLFCVLPLINLPLYTLLFLCLKVLFSIAFSIIKSEHVFFVLPGVGLCLFWTLIIEYPGCWLELAIYSNDDGWMDGLS